MLLSVAQSNLGVRYMTGDGVKKDYDSGVQWLRIAANALDPDAQYHLGIAYDNGFGVRRDPVAALMWVQLAAAQNHELAQSEEKAMMERMSPRQIANAQQMARDWRPK